jgi:two-component system, chemotaxis family, protein-glutamate methylesterase/glutaminase
VALARPKIVVADDSSFMRRLLSTALTEGGFDVVGVAEDGAHALALCELHRPDALSLDLAMPGMHGLDVLRALRASASSIPVVVVSAFSPAFGARAIDALAEGAFDLVAKPAAGEPLETFLTDLREKIRAAAGSTAKSAPAVTTGPVVRTHHTRANGRRAVVIATSTGGPRALAELVPKLPARLGEGTLIVQHMPAGFTASLAQRLDGASSLDVREAATGDRAEPGAALLAPGGSHLRLGGGGIVKLSDDDAVGGLRPRADLTIEDAARVWGSRLLLVVLTGMGKDGLAGAEAVKAAGGRILVEAESTCTVYGMPRAVAEAGLADATLPLSELPAAIATEAGA